MCEINELPTRVLHTRYSYHIAQTAYDKGRLCIPHCQDVGVTQKLRAQISQLGRYEYNALTMHIHSTLDRSSLSKQDWDTWIEQSPSGHLLQSWSWGEFKSRFGWEAQRITVAEDGHISAAAQVLFRALPGEVYTTAYVPKGPVLDSEASITPATPALMDALHTACRRKRALFLKLEPDWEDSPQARAWFASQGFVTSQQTVQPQRSVLIDLRPDEEAILAKMKPKTRYNVRLAQRKGINVRSGGADDLGTFYRLLQVTGQRDHFGIHTQPYYELAWQRFAAEGHANLLLALYQAEVVAGLLVFAWAGKAYYMYGASSNEQRQRMPNHLLQWEAMRWAKDQGCHTYDLWGIPDIDEERIGTEVAVAEEQGVLSTGLGGLYRFKRGFGGRVVRYVGAYDYIYNRPLYRLLTTVWNWHKLHS